MDLPQGVDSKFRLILIAARRARQLQAGARPRVQSPSKKMTKISLQEVQSGLVPFEVYDAETENAEKTKKGKSAK